MLRERTSMQDDQIAELRAERDQFENTYYEVVEQKSAETNALQNQIQALTGQLEQARNLRTDRERELEEELTKRSLESDSTRMDLETRRAAAEGRVATLGADLAASDQQRLAAVNQAATAASELAALKKTSGEQAAQIASLNEQMSAAGSEAGSLEQAKASAEAEARELEVANAELRGQVEAGRRLITERQAELDRLKSDMGASAGAVEALADAKAENERLDAELAQANNQIVSLKAKGSVGLSDDPELKSAAASITDRLTRFDSGDQITVSLDGRGLHAIIPSDLAFNQKSVILSEAIKPILVDLADALGQLLPGRLVRVEGHTDDQPTFDLPFADNWGLGAARADRVRQYMTNEGRLDPAQVELSTRSFHAPLAGNDSPEGRARNRRVEIVVGK